MKKNKKISCFLFISCSRLNTSTNEERTRPSLLRRATHKVFMKARKRLEDFINAAKKKTATKKTEENVVGVYIPGGNRRGGSCGHMTACCYAARSKEASDNADRGPQRRRSRAQLRCHSSSLFDGGGREREMVGGGEK